MKYAGVPREVNPLVEDSRFLRLASGRALVKAGYSVVTASDREEALRMACQNVPDLILLDMLLPKLGGLAVLQALRQGPRTAQVPIIVLSSLSQRNEARLKRRVQPHILRNRDWTWIAIRTFSFRS
jgi:CheY-like chemotaxis protein